jgi:hypothetical protein
MNKKQGNSKSIDDIQIAFETAVDSNSSSILQLRITSLEEENAKLKDLVKVLMESRDANVQCLEHLDEEYICEVEIAKIKKRVNDLNMELSLDDVRKLETLWKVKKSAKEYQLSQKPLNPRSSLPKGLTKVEVRQIAASETEDDD